MSKVKVLVTQSCPTLVTPWTVACQAPLSMDFSRQEYWGGLPLSFPGDLPNPGVKSHIMGRFFTTWASISFHDPTFISETKNLFFCIIFSLAVWLSISFIDCFKDMTFGFINFFPYCFSIFCSTNFGSHLISFLCLFWV